MSDESIFKIMAYSIFTVFIILFSVCGYYIYKSSQLECHTTGRKVYGTYLVGKVVMVGWYDETVCVEK